MGKAKNKKTGGKKTMSKKRLAAVEKIERKSKNPPAAPTAGSAAMDKNLAPTPADGETAKLIDQAHGLGLSVAANASASGVKKLLEQFEVIHTGAVSIWQEITSEKIPEDKKISRRLNHVISAFFEDGRKLADLGIDLENKNLSPAADRHIKNALYEEFEDMLGKRGILGRLLGR